MSTWLRIASVSYVECLQVLRDRAAISMILVVPMIQVLLFGYAVRALPKDVPIAISRTADDSSQISHLNTGPFRTVADRLPAGKAETLARRGDCLIGIEIELSGRTRVYLNDLEPLLAFQALSELKSSYLLEQQRQQSSALDGIRNSIKSARTFELIRLFNSENRAEWSIAPPLIGMVVMITMLMLGSLSLVREVEAGCWEARLTTPIANWEILVGKAIPYLLLGLLQSLALVAACSVLFQLPWRGGWWLWLMCSIVHATAYLTAGLAVSALAKNQLQAVQGAVLFYLPSILLSGFLLPFASMPVWAQTVGNLLPFSHYVRISRSVVLGGAGWADIQQEVLAICIFAVVAASLAILLKLRRE
jgi:ABC-2 type transport system permease protein